MSDTMKKIEKLAIHHKVIGAKTDCPYFSTVGRLCSRVENGMMRCDEYLECEFKYIDALKEENENLKQQLEIDKNQINYFIEENEKQKEQIKQLEDFIKSDGEIDYINHEYTYKLKQENERLKVEKVFLNNYITELKFDKKCIKEKLDYVFEDLSTNYERFCDICCAKETCNGNCCYEQIKEILYKVK